MRKSLRVILLGVLVFLMQSRANAFVAPPNDSVHQAIDLGPLDAPGLCPGSPAGNYDSITGTTNGATVNLEFFSPLHCYGSPSPDVWYKFQATGSYCYVELTGLNGFSNFYLKMFFSEGSPITLLPGQCITSTGNTLSFMFPTPTINGI